MSGYPQEPCWAVCWKQNIFEKNRCHQKSILKPRSRTISLVFQQICCKTCPFFSCIVFSVSRATKWYVIVQLLSIKSGKNCPVPKKVEKTPFSGKVSLKGDILKASKSHIVDNAFVFNSFNTNSSKSLEGPNSKRKSGYGTAKSHIYLRLRKEFVRKFSFSP